MTGWDALTEQHELVWWLPIILVALLAINAMFRSSRRPREPAHLGGSTATGFTMSPRGYRSILIAGTCSRSASTSMAGCDRPLPPIFCGPAASASVGCCSPRFSLPGWCSSSSGEGELSANAAAIQPALSAGLARHRDRAGPSRDRHPMRQTWPRKALMPRDGAIIFRDIVGYSNAVNPVALPPGLAMLLTNPAPTGSMAFTNTIGTL
jgi:hypothetical protein